MVSDRIVTKVSIQCTNTLIVNETSSFLRLMTKESSVRQTILKPSVVFPGTIHAMETRSLCRSTIQITNLILFR